MAEPIPTHLRAGEIRAGESFSFDAFDSLLQETSGIDTFCSSSCWAESARRAFLPDAPIVTYRHRDAMAVFSLVRTGYEARMLAPLDATWALGSPLAASHPRRDISALFSTMLQDGDQIDYAVLSGLKPDHPFYRIILCALSELHVPLTRFRPATRAVARIDDGVDAWLKRRSSKFRAGIRRSFRQLENTNIRFVHLRSCALGAERMKTFHEIETRSWKGKAHTGLDEPAMARFCSSFLTRTSQRGQSRAMLAFDGGRPIGFIFGAVANGRYRGAQMSFDDAYRHIGLGNILQVKMIQSLAEEGVGAYDLGSFMPYKARWADREERTESILVGPFPTR